MKKLLFMLLLMAVSLGGFAQQTYEIYKLSGTARVDGMRALLKVGGKVKTDTKLDLTRCTLFALLDKSSRKVYYLKPGGKQTVERAVMEVRSRASNMSTRVLNTVLASKAETRESWGQLGAAMRGADDVIDDNTQVVYGQVYATLNILLDRAKTSSLDIEAVREFVSPDAFVFRVSNRTDKPLFFNVLYLPKGGGEVSMVYATDDDMPCLMVDAGGSLRLSDDICLAAGGRYVLVAADAPFYSSDIVDMVEQGEQPSVGGSANIDVKVWYVK